MYKIPKPEKKEIKIKCGTLAIEVKEGKKEHYLELTQKNNLGEEQGVIRLDLDDIYKFKGPFNDAFTYLLDQAYELKITLEDMHKATKILKR